MANLGMVSMRLKRNMAMNAGKHSLKISRISSACHGRDTGVSSKVSGRVTTMTVMSSDTARAMLATGRLLVLSSSMVKATIGMTVRSAMEMPER